jgi:hypothetical protein
VRAVKIVLIASLLLCAASALAAGPAAPAPVAPAPAARGAAPGRVSLLCTGVMPAYTAWENPAVPTEVQSAQLVIEIDRAAAQVVTGLPLTGEVSARLELTDRFYSASSPQGRIVFGRSLDAVELSINRLNGEARLRYMVGETSFPAFTGNCALRSRS